MKTALLKRNAIHAALVGLICGIEVAVYAALGPAGLGLVANPLYWACFIMIPVVFMQGGQWSALPLHAFNLVFGMLAGGWLCFLFVGLTAASIGLPLSFGIFTCLCVLLVMFCAMTFAEGGVKPFLGNCPMAFTGMCTVFAACGDAVTLEPYLVALVSLLVGTVCATLMVQSGTLAAKLAGGQDASA